MTQCNVTLVAYDNLTLAFADWDAMVTSDRVTALGLVDAALVEGDVETIQMFHRHLTSTHAQGAAAGAIVGLLRPTAIVTGALAGGVGANVLMVIERGLTRLQVKELGEVMDASPIALVAL